MASTLPRLPIFEAIARHDPKSTAVVHSASGRRFTYGQLLGDVAERKEKLLQESRKSGIEGERIAFLVENSYDYIGAHNELALLQTKGIDCVNSDLPEYSWCAFNCVASLASLSSE
jgi:acyl-CoA synthetase (AMP-forming)/AMP-acid ligase II